MGWWVKPIGRWSTRESTDEKERAEIKKIRQKQSTMEAGQSTIGNESESVLIEFDSCVNLFLFLVVFVFFRRK
jgi:hypothetical protein